MPSNGEIAALFEEMASLLEMKGEIVFKVRAYQRAARTISGLPFSLEERVKSGGPLRDIPGIGEAIDGKVREYLETGKVRALETLRADLPEGVHALMAVPGIGPKTAVLIARELGVSTVEGPEQAIKDGRVGALPRIGEKTAQNLLARIHALAARVSDKRVPLGVAVPAAERFIEALRARAPSLGEASPAGSVRRWREAVRDILILATASNHAEVLDALPGLPDVIQVLKSGPDGASLAVRPGAQIDFQLVDADRYGSILQYETGSREHNALLRQRATALGFALDEGGVTELATGRIERFSSEDALYARLGLQTPPPEIREGTAEIELASRGALPVLVTLSSLKGDLHVHSDWSDGREPMEAMVAACAARGYQYMALTDHSVGLGVANGLNDARLLEQRAALRAIAERHGIPVLHGSEVDIRADGSLDFSDEALSGLDLVVASVHSAMGQSREKMTARVIKAMQHPSVSIIGHLTARLIGERDPTNVDVEAVVRAARETGTVLEVNSSPERLDLKAEHIKLAREAGVPLVVDTDSHHSRELANMRYGVSQARRGWCEARDIINCMPREAFLAFIRMSKPERAAYWAQRPA